MDRTLGQRFSQAALFLVNPLAALEQTGDVMQVYKTGKITAWRLLTPFAAKCYGEDDSAGNAIFIIRRQRKRRDVRIRLDYSEHPNISEGRAATYRRQLEDLGLASFERDALIHALAYAALDSADAGNLPNLLPLGAITNQALSETIAKRAAAVVEFKKESLTGMGIVQLHRLAENLTPASRGLLLPMAGELLLHKDTTCRCFALQLFDSCVTGHERQATATLVPLLKDDTISLTDTIVSAYGSIVHDLDHFEKTNGLNLLIDLTQHHAPAIVRTALIPLRQFDRMSPPDQQIALNVLADRPDELDTVLVLAGHVGRAVADPDPKALALLARGLQQPAIAANATLQTTLQAYSSVKTERLRAAQRKPTKPGRKAADIVDGKLSL